MPRLHLFEWEDQRWFPGFIRDYMTDYLRFVTTKADMYQGAVPVLRKGIAKSGNQTIIDLASGGGGGWLKIAEHLRAAGEQFQVVLTDYFPNIPAFKRMEAQGGGQFSYHSESVSALDVPEHLQGLRTQFLSFHHFKPEDAQQILQNAVDRKASIAIFEAQERSIAHFIQFFFSPIFVLLLTPLIRPFRLGRLIFTYLIPIVPLAVFWDGLVSVLRTYTPSEMEAMTQQLQGGDQYEWEIGKTKTGQVTVVHLLGYPKS